MLFLLLLGAGAPAGTVPELPEALTGTIIIRAQLAATVSIKPD